MAERQELSVGTQVRNVKTRNVGEVKDFTNQETAVVEYEMSDPAAGPFKSKAASRIQDLEVLNKGEFHLVRQLAEARAKKTQAAQALEEASSLAAKAEDEMIDYLISHDVDSTKVYEGFGVARIDGQRVCPSIKKEDEALAFAELREAGHGEVIKETVHPKTLESLIGELIKTGKPVPEHIKYYLRPKVALRKS